MKKPKGLRAENALLQQIIKTSGNEVWTANDFTALGSRSAIDKVLQRLVATGELRRIDRGRKGLLGVLDARRALPRSSVRRSASFA